MVWAKEQARLETLKYKQEQECRQIQITFHADRQLDYDKQAFFQCIPGIGRPRHGSDFIQPEFYKNSHFLGKRNDKILYFDCSNYYKKEP